MPTHILMDAATDKAIRAATEAEIAASEAADKAGHAGIFPCDWRSEGGWNGEDYRDCYTRALDTGDDDQ